MCKECENNLNVNEELEDYIQLENQEFDIEDMNEEQLRSVIYQLLDEDRNLIKLNVNNLNNIKVDLSEFKRGVKEASYIAGYYNCLRNCGLNSKDAYELSLNKDTINHNVDIAKINVKNEKIVNEQNCI